MKLGFVGAGNMAGAIIRGAVKSGSFKGADLHVYDLDGVKVDQLAQELGIVKYNTCDALSSDSDMILFGVKPNQLLSVLKDQQNRLADKAVLSIAAGWSAKMLKGALPEGARVLRVMPNTPAMVGEGMTALSRETGFTEEERAQAEALFGSIGRTYWVDERQMEAVIGVSGSGPAYAYMFIEAMADGGVALGLTRQQALTMAAQTLLGASKMALDSGYHPGELKDMVCSPGGTTIAAVRSLEQHGFRGAVIDAVVASAERALEMQK